MERALVRWGHILAVAAVAWTIAAAHAEIPRLISYQGKVTDTSGNPVADGNYSMRFRIYDAVTGGTMLWDSGWRNVSVSGGVFSVLLGDTGQPTLSLEFDDDYWLLVTFETADQSPRARLVSAGYAYMASGLVPGTMVSGSVTAGDAAAIVAWNMATAGNAYGVYGKCSATDGGGICGSAMASQGQTNGVVGLSYSTQGRGVCGLATATAGTSYGGWFETSSPIGRGVYGRASSTGSGATCGGLFESGSSTGMGVWARAYAASGQTYGVYGTSSSPQGVGVYGDASAVTGTPHGVYGTSSSPSGVGVYGLVSGSTGTPYGVLGEVQSSAGAAVCGRSMATSGDANGLYGSANTADGSGVFGEGMATAYWAYGVTGLSHSPAGRGVVGWVDAATGINFGVYGTSWSTEGRGVFGFAQTAGGENFGVYGMCASSDGVGVNGYAYATVGQTEGVFGIAESTEGRGVVGWAKASSGTTRGVYGRSDSTSGYGVYYVGGIGGTGIMTSIVRTTRGPTGLGIHTTAGDWVEDFGEGRLVKGQAHVELDHLYLEMVTIDVANPSLVFIELADEQCNGVAVHRGLTGFDLVERGGGQSSCAFWYRVVAKRRGFEARRLVLCEDAMTDPHLYPERGDADGRQPELWAAQGLGSSPDGRNPRERMR